MPEKQTTLVMFQHGVDKPALDTWEVPTDLIPRTMIPETGDWVRIGDDYELVKVIGRIFELPDVIICLVKPSIVNVGS